MEYAQVVLRRFERLSCAAMLGLLRGGVDRDQERAASLRRESKAAQNLLGWSLRVQS